MSECTPLKRINDILLKNNSPRFDLMLAGDTGSGKSSTLNCFLSGQKAQVGNGPNPETSDIDVYNIADKIYFWDTPGLGDSPENDKKYINKILYLLEKKYENSEKAHFIDVLLIVAESHKKDMGSIYTLLEGIKQSQFPPQKIILAINQADIAMKGHHWQHNENKPDQHLDSFLHEKAISVQRRIYDTTGIKINNPIFYSALKNYNISSLVNEIENILLNFADDFSIPNFKIDNGNNVNNIDNKSFLLTDKNAICGHLDQYYFKSNALAIDVSNVWSDSPITSFGDISDLNFFAKTFQDLDTKLFESTYKKRYSKLVALKNKAETLLKAYLPYFCAANDILKVNGRNGIKLPEASLNIILCAPQGADDDIGEYLLDVADKIRDFLDSSADVAEELNALLHSL